MSNEKSKEAKPPEAAHKARIERYGEAKTRTLQVARYIRENINSYDRNHKNKLKNAVKKLELCGNWLIYHHYYTIDQYRLVGAILCKNKWLDGLCGIRWADKAVSEYYARHLIVTAQNQGLKTVFLTLTVRNKSKLMDAYNVLDSSLKKMSYNIRNAKKGRSNSEFGKIQGMVGGIEIKKGRRSKKWHPHFHAIALVSDYLDHAKLKAEWHRMTGDSFIVHVEEVTGDINTFCEVLSYTLKVSTMDAPDIVWAYLKLRGKAMVRAWGLYRGVKVPDELTDDPIEELPYARILYNYVYQNSGYSIGEVTFHRAEGHEVDPFQEEVSGEKSVEKNNNKLSVELQ